MSSSLRIQSIFPFILIFLSYLQQCFVVYSVQVFSLVKFIPQNFMLFDTITSEIIFLISFLNWSLLVYRNAKTKLYNCVLLLLYLFHQGIICVVVQHSNSFVFSSIFMSDYILIIPTMTFSKEKRALLYR